ncbi:MAG: hypothetical protein RMJ56_12400 [Gemmataceae bacterium]|nr:hypothetical protein [Gemmata sp.]MDW8198394.1 hypothetical protein [Gemmataceae bacterium]
MKVLGVGILAAASVLVAVSSAWGLVVALPAPGQMAAQSPVVLTGKVTKIEEKEVEAPTPFHGAKEKQKYKIAVVKVDSVLAGAERLQEVRIGFIPPPKVDPNQPVRPRPPIGRPGLGQTELKPGQERLFFLAQHPHADFYIIPNMSIPIDITTAEGKKQLDEVKKVTAVLADPRKALQSDQADVRAEAAAIMVMKYRAYPLFGGEVDQVPINAEESQLILKALADAEWKDTRFGQLSPLQAFYQLGLTEKDGWIQPMIVTVPGQPAPDFNAIMKDAYTRWLATAGKNYRIKKFVPKTTQP